jgi:hypothetical protein
MAICAVLDASGYVIQQAATALDACQGFVMLDKADWTQYGLVQSLITIPNSADFSAAWMAGFVPPMAVGLVAACVSKIISVWDN